MIQRICILVLLYLTGINPLFAGQETLEDLMRKDDYIGTTLVIISPGPALYSAGGHLAIRMSCPTQDVDYVYEYDATLNSQDESLVLSYLNGSLKGDYVRLFATDFYNKMHNEGRTCDEYPLNLTPEQEIKLWSSLDDAVDSASSFPFSPAQYNCCSMVLTLVDDAVQPGIFSSPQVSNVLNGSNRKYLDDFFAEAPWRGLFWNTILGIEFDTPLNAHLLFYPKIIGKYVPLIINPANGKPLIDKDSKVTAFNNGDNGVSAPSLMFILTLALAVCLTALNISGRLIALSRAFDILLLVVISAIGCVLWYMFAASLFGDKLYINTLMILFTPIPIVTAILRRASAWQWYIKSTCAISLILLFAVYFIIQIQLYCIWAFVATIFVRSLYHMCTKKNKFNHKTISA